MFSVTTAQLYAWLAAFLWPFARILAIITTEPLLGNRSVPVTVKIGFALFITLIVAPLLGPMPNVQPGSAAGLLILGQQVLIGLAIGFSMRIVYSAIEMAGHLAGLQMGLGFATFFDPQNSTQVAVIAQFLGLLAILLFLASNGHLMVVMALADSFNTLPISGQLFSSHAWPALVAWGGEIFRMGLLLSLPLAAAMLTANLSLGIMTRAAPQLNIFTVGFPVTIAAGFLVLLLAMPYMAPQIEQLLQQGVGMMLKIPELARVP